MDAVSWLLAFHAGFPSVTLPQYGGHYAVHVALELLVENSLRFGKTLLHLGRFRVWISLHPVVRFGRRYSMIRIEGGDSLQGKGGEDDCDNVRAFHGKSPLVEIG